MSRHEFRHAHEQYQGGADPASGQDLRDDPFPQTQTQTPYRSRRRTRMARRGGQRANPLTVAAAAGAVVLAGVASVSAFTGQGSGVVQDLIGAAAATQPLAAPSPAASPGAAAPGNTAALTSGAAVSPGSPSPAAAAAGTPPDATAAAAAAAEVAAPDPALGTPAGTAAAPATAPAPAAPIALAPVTAAAAAVANANCTLIVPADPLSAKGLATPYQLVATDPAQGPCEESTAVSSTFVQAAIISPSGRITLYNPLVVDQGTAAGAPPARAQVPRGATVGIWFGFNGDSLTLQSADGGNSLAQGRCVNGSATSIFGQFAYCNAPRFFAAANAAIARRDLRIPRLGTARDGLPCPTVRDFSVVDQDQSDNVNTHYLASADGSTGQPNAKSAALLGAGAKDLANGSDNRLLAEFILPTLGCTTFTRPDQSNDAKATASLPLQELEAAARQDAPVALVPLNDPMTLEGDASSVEKTNLFRAGVNQPRIGRRDNGDPAAYCRGIFTDPRGIQRVFKAQSIYAQGVSPNAKTTTNLFTFLATRASDTFDILGCGALLNEANPIALTNDPDGRVGAATFGGATAKAAAVSASPSPSASLTASPSASAAAPSAPAASQALVPVATPSASTPLTPQTQTQVASPDPSPSATP